MKILIAEDDLTSRLMLKNLLLHWGYEVVAAVDGKEAWEILQQPTAPAIALLDWVMPGLDGIEVCRKVRAQETIKSFYLIILTSLTGKKDLIQGLNAGADDFLTKPYDSDELQARLNVGRRVIELQEKLLELSNTDALTSLGNRRRFFESAKSEIHRSMRYYTPLSLILADLDAFKIVNDSYGHKAGDYVLVECSRLLVSALRDTDVVCRMGGDEFAVILPQTELLGATCLAERIRRQIEQHEFFCEDADGFSQIVRITVSMGVGELSATDRSIDDLYQRTDSLLYTAKNEGRNRAR